MDAGVHPDGVILKLDPRWPLTWRTPTSVQIGVDPIRVLLDGVTTTDERMLAALAVGISRPGLELIGRGDTQPFLDQLEPVLLTTTTAALPPTVAITGVGTFVLQLASALGHHGVEVLIAAHAEDFSQSTPDLAVAVGHYVVHPELRGYWLRRDVPHLPVVFADSAVTIGPLIEPGRGPCLVCVELHRRDDDPAWPAVATQLMGRRGSFDHAVLVSEAVGAVGRAVLARLGAGDASGGASVRIDAATGARQSRQWEQHPECGCAAVPVLSAQVGQEAAG
ncbi:cyclodehydratase [soil metagenome]